MVAWAARTMKSMTSRERLLCTLGGGIPDRVPVAPFVQDEYLAYYYPHKESVDRVTDAKELADEFDFDLIAKPRQFEHPHFFRKSYAGWEVRRDLWRADGREHETLEIVTPRGTLRQEEVGPDVGAASAGIHKAVSKHLLDSDEAVEIFLEFLPALDDASIGAGSDQQPDSATFEIVAEARSGCGGDQGGDLHIARAGAHAVAGFPRCDKSESL